MDLPWIFIIITHYYSLPLAKPLSMPYRDFSMRNYKECLNLFAPPLATAPGLGYGSRSGPPFLKGGGHVRLSLYFHSFLCCPYFLLKVFFMLYLYNCFERLSTILCLSAFCICSIC